VKAISIDNFFNGPVGQLDYQGAIIIDIKRQAFGYLLPGNNPDLSL
jgi:hypothetical protein